MGWPTPRFLEASCSLLRICHRILLLRIGVGGLGDGDPLRRASFAASPLFLLLSLPRAVVEPLLEMVAMLPSPVEPPGLAPDPRGFVAVAVAVVVVVEFGVEHPELCCSGLGLGSGWD